MMKLTSHALVVSIAGLLVGCSTHPRPDLATPPPPPPIPVAPLATVAAPPAEIRPDPFVAVLDRAEREFAAAPPLKGDIPLAVLSAERGQFEMPPGLGWVSAAFQSTRLEVHQQLAKRSTKGHWQMVPESTHLIASSQPDAVVKAVLSLLETLQ